VIPKRTYSFNLIYAQKDFDNCKARIEGRYSQIQPERSAQPSKFTSATTTGSKSTQTNAKAQTAHGKVTITKPVEAPKKDDNWWEAAALFEFMQKAVNQRVLRAGRNQITVDRVAELVVRRYEIEEVEIAKNVLLVHAQNLCYMMEHPRRKAVQFFASEPIYKELAAGHDLSAAEQRRAEGVELKPRRDHGTLRDGENESSDTSDEEDAITTPVRRPPGRRKQGRLSVLRPRSGKFSGKSKGISIKPGRQKGGGRGRRLYQQVTIRKSSKATRRPVARKTRELTHRRKPYRQVVRREN